MCLEMLQESVVKDAFRPTSPALIMEARSAHFPIPQMVL